MKKLTRYLLLGIVALLCSGYAWADPVTVTFQGSIPPGSGATATFSTHVVSGTFPTWTETVTAQFVSGNYILNIRTAPGTVTETVYSGGEYYSDNGTFGTGGIWELYNSGQLLASGIVLSATTGSIRSSVLPPENSDAFSAVLGGSSGSGQVSVFTQYTGSIYNVSGSVTVAPVPEPTSVALLGSGVLALGRTVKRRLAAKKQADCASS